MRKINLFKVVIPILFLFGMILLFLISKTKKTNEMTFGFASGGNEIQEEIDTEIEIHPVRVYLFASSTCPHCKEEEEFLGNLVKRLPFLEVERFEISNNSKFAVKKVFTALSREHKTFGSVPLTIIGNNLFVGFDSSEKMGAEFSQVIKSCALNSCQSSLDKESDLVELPTFVKQKVSLELLEETLGKSNN